MADVHWAPDWARNAIFYQIYAPGFLDAPPRSEPDGAVVPRLADLRRWYDHIINLGATALYIGPLFESHTHGYDTIDYYQIDRRLGDVSLFKALLGELHERGIRVIVDGVFDHTGRGFFAFEDILQRGQESEYRDWYLINWGDDNQYGDGFAYDAWHGHEQLPRLNLQNADVRAYVFDVARYWLREVGVDGWRLDMAHEIDPGFWWEFRRVCKAINPDYFLLGELAGGDYRTWVAPDLLDAGTDYQVYTAMWRSLNEANFFELKAATERAYHPEWGVFRNLTLVNFLSNHDVSRIASRLNARRHVFAAMILLTTLPGIPCLYYGDEVGMEGRKEDGDAALRRPMPPTDTWPDADRRLYRQTARLAGLRKGLPALVQGDFNILDVSDTVFSFVRRLGGQVVVVVVNAGAEAIAADLALSRTGIGDQVTFRDVLDEQRVTYRTRDGHLAIDRVWPGWGRILVSEASQT